MAFTLASPWAVGDSTTKSKLDVTHANTVALRDEACTFTGVKTFNSVPVFAGGTPVSSGDPAVCDGRLTLTTGLPVTIADVTAAGTIYYAPYKGNKIGLYNGTTWDILIFAELSLALTATSGKPYDVFIYNNEGTATLETLVWTDDTTRATALVRQDGIYCKTGALTRRYIGTFYASGANTTEDSRAKRYLWNYYHRIYRTMKAQEATTSWTYSVNAWRQARATATNQLDFVSGVAEDTIFASTLVGAAYTAATGYAASAIGLDGISPLPDSLNSFTDNGVIKDLTSTAECPPQVGRHVLVWMEHGSTGTITYYNAAGLGSQNVGILGRILA